MRTYAICPVTDKLVNERVTRLNALFTVLILLGFVSTGYVFLVAFLSLDFLLRASNTSKYSLIMISSRNLVRYLPVKELYINAGPKIFAARIGFILSGLIVLSFISSFDTVSYIFTGILGLFSFLEAALGLCVACKIYPYLYRFLYRE